MPRRLMDAQESEDAISWNRLLIRLGVAVGTLTVLILVVSFWPRGAVRTSSTSEVWTCSMHPQIRLPSPENCPLCGMTLIPVSQLSGERDQLEERAGLEVEAIRRSPHGRRWPMAWPADTLGNPFDPFRRIPAVAGVSCAQQVDREHG